MSNHCFYPAIYRNYEIFTQRSQSSDSRIIFIYKFPPLGTGMNTHQLNQFNFFNKFTQRMKRGFWIYNQPDLKSHGFGMVNYMLQFSRVIRRFEMHQNPFETGFLRIPKISLRLGCHELRHQTKWPGLQKPQIMPLYSF